MIDRAGPTEKIECPNCNKQVTVYSRSYYGVGKKCPYCGFLMGRNF